MPDIDGLETAAPDPRSTRSRRTRRSSSSPPTPTRCRPRRATRSARWTTSSRRWCPTCCAARCACSSTSTRCSSAPAPWPGEQVARARAEAARAAAEETTRRSNFLARASHELGASLDLEQGMRRLLDLVVPEMADGAALVVDAEADRPLLLPQEGFDRRAVRLRRACPSRCARRCSAWCAKDCRTRARWCATRCASASARSARWR